MHRFERGVSLAEVLVAMFILSAVGVATIAGVGTTVKVNEVARARITAESLARSELEYVISENYTKLYPITVPPTNPNWSYSLSESTVSYASWDVDQLHNGQPWDYPGYTITVSSEVSPGGIQMITASVRDIYSPDPGKTVLTIVTYLADPGPP
jgi:type II secretory pathway pseudopilin PulG